MNRIGNDRRNGGVRLDGAKGPVRIRRLGGGFPRIEARDRLDLFFGLGYAHGRDRARYMELLRLITEGRLSECLMADDDLIGMDRAMRWIGLNTDRASELAGLAPETRDVLEAYARGVNLAFSRHGRPLIFRLLGHRPAPWTPADSLGLGKLAGYLGLSQSQADLEKFVIQLIKLGVSPDRLRDLFPNIDQPMTDELLDAVARVRMIRPPVPMTGRFPSGASNNWALSPGRTASGRAMLCGDPHLALFLPSIWYPFAAVCPDRYYLGAGMPGVPVLIAGRTPDLAWSVTFSPSDVCDWFIEDVSNGRCRRGDGWEPLAAREETIRPKGRPPERFTVYESPRGILETDAAEDGLHLALAWSGRVGSGDSLSGFLAVMESSSVDEAMPHFAGLAWAPFNWVLADAAGRIGYQMSGRIPIKDPPDSGLLPRLGWDPRQDWRGFADPSRHPRAVDPAGGFLATANNDLNHLAPDLNPVNLPMSHYRASRIAECLATGRAHTTAGMQALQHDLYSLQAERFLDDWRPLLPDSDNGRLLAGWDCRYEADSLGATLFERVYEELLLLVFGELGLGREAMVAVIHDSSAFTMLHGHFDRVLLSGDSPWFAGRRREDLVKKAIRMGLAAPAARYGETRRFTVRNLFFDGRLPRFLGVDFGPIEHVGSRATIPQSQLFRFMGRPAAAAATLRLVTDFSEDAVYIQVAGGASDCRWSGHYVDGLKDWQTDRYYRFGADPDPGE